MDQLTAPKAGDDLRDLRELLTEFVRRFNALGNAKIIFPGQKNDLSITEGNATLEIGCGGLRFLPVVFCEDGAEVTRYVLVADAPPAA